MKQCCYSNNINKMRDLFSIEDISVYRSELMGWSILWVMMLHFTFNQIDSLGFVAQYGFAGVDIFMMVSGLGLYYSLNKYPNILLFYRKRLLRIFPTYYILGCLASIFLFNDSFIEFLFRYTTIGYWTGGLYWEWYIPSIVILYLFSPFIKYLLDKKNLLIALISVSMLILAFYLVDKDQILDRIHFFFLYRIPAFIFGMICAFWIQNNISSKYYMMLLIVGIPFWGCFFPQHHQIYNYKYFSLLFLLPFFILVFILLSKYLRFLNPILRILGSASLEIYLIQGMFFYAIINEFIIVPQIVHDTMTIALIFLCSLLGIMIHWIIEKCILMKLFR